MCIISLKFVQQIHSRYTFTPVDKNKKTVIITLMKRLLILLTAIFIINIPVQAEEFEVNTLEMRDYDEIVLPVGSFIPVMTTQEISTETCPEGYKLKFIAIQNSSDI